MIWDWLFRKLGEPTPLDPLWERLGMRTGPLNENDKVIIKQQVYFMLLPNLFVLACTLICWWSL